MVARTRLRRASKGIFKEIGMVSDDDTAYDEVMEDIEIVMRNFVANKEAQGLALKKLNQLRRLTGLQEEED